MLYFVAVSEHHEWAGRADDADVIISDDRDRSSRKRYLHCTLVGSVVPCEYYTSVTSLPLRETFGCELTIFNLKKTDTFLNNAAAQGRRNVTQSERASETSISSRAKTNLSTMDLYADLSFPRPGESFSV